MKLLLCLSLLLSFAVPARAAGEEDRVAATQALVDYFNAVITLDTQRVSQYCNEPFMYLDSARSSSFATRSDVEAWLKPGFAALKERGYGRSEWPQLQVKVLGNGVALASALIVRYKVDGTEMSRAGATYFMRKTQDGWKLVSLTVHDTSTVLKLD